MPRSRALAPLGLPRPGVRDRSRSRSVTAAERTLAAALLARVGGPPLRLVLWDGQPVGPADATHDIVVRDRRTFLSLLADPEVTFGDGYGTGRIDVRGDLVGLLESIYRAAERSGLRPGLLGRAFARLRRRNTRRGSRSNVHHHYDLGNDFYRLWLDEQMLYTCAYFPTPEATLEEAQVAKMDHVCRKLRLTPGERVIEAGCGWGAFALHMARHYGVQVEAYNLSTEQVRWARERARREGLEARVTFVQEDYRAARGRHDAFVSIGMLEHVGRDHYDELGQVIERALEPHGRGLLHTIGRTRSLPLNRWIARRIFPGAYPPTLQEILPILEPHDLTVLDVENLRPHYARTIEHWLERFDAAAPHVRECFDERFERVWRLYLAGSIAAFRTGSLELFQVLFARRNAPGFPWTRRHLYAEHGAV